MSDNLVLRLARHRLQEYADDAELMRQHAEAVECRDCEEFLQAGIDTFRFLRTAEELLREADWRGLHPMTPETREALHFLYAAWVEPCEDTKCWIRILSERGFKPDNADEFNRVSDEAHELLERSDWQRRATHARVLASAGTAAG
ncbi:MAG: hypothetical protein KY476_01100 [Planctomycetes bacterium]|nr:hypothetical protein [Planctomycetota bacterium]